MVAINLKEEIIKRGSFYEPTLLSGVPVESPVCQEEVFGPVACAIPFKSFDEVMKVLTTHLLVYQQFYGHKIYLEHCNL